MLYPQKKHLQFLLKASNQHGVHSPFVYQLITKCFYTKLDKSLWKTYLTTKKQLIKDKKSSKITDSKVGEITNKKARLVLKIAHYFKPKKILNIGTSLSLVTSVLEKGNDAAIITPKENNIETVSKITQNKHFDLIYFDGKETKKEALAYFETCLKTVGNESVFIFDNIYSNAEIQETWLAIKEHSKVTVTVDLFYLGIIFFRKEQAKEHFKIRV